MELDKSSGRFTLGNHLVVSRLSGPPPPSPKKEKNRRSGFELILKETLVEFPWWEIRHCTGQRIGNQASAGVRIRMFQSTAVKTGRPSTDGRKDIIYVRKTIVTSRTAREGV